MMYFLLPICLSCYHQVSPVTIIISLFFFHEDWKYFNESHYVCRSCHKTYSEVILLVSGLLLKNYNKWCQSVLIKMMKTHKIFGFVTFPFTLMKFCLYCAVPMSYVMLCICLGDWNIFRLFLRNFFSKVTGRTKSDDFRHLKGSKIQTHGD